MNSNLTSHRNLCHIISPLANTKDIARLKDQVARSEIAWERVIYMANTHFIISALWVGLCEKKIDSMLENEVRNYLQNLHKLNIRRNHGLKRQAIEAVEVLNKKGIVPMLIKGAVQLFQPVHKDFGARMMTDLDILVPKDQLDEAIKALIQVGYEAYKNSNLDFNTHHHAAPLVRAGEYGSIELHHTALGSRIANQVLSTTEILAAGEECITAEIRYKIPIGTHSVLLAILHSQITHEYHQGLTLDYKALHDMVAMACHQNIVIDWNQILSRFTKYGLRSILQTHLWIAHQLFNLPVQKGMEPSANSRIYYGLYLAKIRWEFFDHWYDRILSFYTVRLKKRFGFLKQVFVCS